MYAGAAHADSNEYGYCVSLWNYALKLKLEKETLVSCDTAFTARAIVQLYINIQARYLNNSDPYDENPLKFEDVLTTTRYLKSGMEQASELLDLKPQYQSQLDNFDIVLTTWIHLIHILLQLAETPEHMTLVLEEVLPLLKMHAKTQKTGDTLLHLAVSSTSTLHR